ncbi:triple tyrosine motif-containing protein [Clostridium thermarum]|uniref:triple tyrosine motif-containing protein n=1 Tax=Clostridium thermarum TaxID=1716543 RepID=UPI00111DDA70|nr:triple tyrosine motif-containing protein [Clostridium thermarum]
MSQMEISFSIPSPASKNNEIRISVGRFNDEKLLYKFIVGYDGVWDTLKDFGEENAVVWTPKEDGKYIIMVQAKKVEGTRPFDYVARMDYIIGKATTKLINNVSLERSQLKIGDKQRLTVSVNKLPVVYKYWIKTSDKWELIRDYSAEDTLTLTVKNPGKHEVLVECRALDSRNSYDDFKKVEFNVLPIENLEITDFRCLSTDMLVDQELVFQVEAKHEDSRMVLFKFIKIYANGKADVLQDYSTKRMVSYVEKEAGNYRLLCMAKDMYSQNQFDDRAIIDYKVKLYNEIQIQSFTSDMLSPQIVDSSIELKAVVKGGRRLLYRFIVEGNSASDSGYIKQSNYIWKPQRAGKYKLSLWVKDESFTGKFEKEAVMEFVIDEVSNNPVKITEIAMSKDKDFVIGEKINVKVIATGGTDLRYSFIISKGGKELERVDYGSCNWVNYTPEEVGNFEMEIRVKDKYSKKEYDSHEIIHLEVKKYLPAEIDYVLMPSKENYIVGDNIKFDVITRRTQDTLIKYVLKINGHTVEETDYISSKRYFLSPKCRGSYVLEIMAKDKSSLAVFDSKKIIKLNVIDALPVSNTKILWDKINIKVNEPVIFSVEAQGGKDLYYEFYLMEHGDWILVQKYSKMNYYTFIPYKQGNYKILALVKSMYNEGAYEDYDIMEFNVN